jgi:hypothetical protein
LPTSFSLMGLSVVMALEYIHIRAAGSGASPRAARLALEVLAVHSMLLAGWAWSGGYLAGRLSRRTVWLSLVAYGFPCLFCLSRFRIEALSRYCLLLFVLPALVGIYNGTRGLRIPKNAASAVALVVTALAILVAARGSNASSRVPVWLSTVITTWPSWYIFAVAWKEQCEVSSAPHSPRTGVST